MTNIVICNRLKSSKMIVKIPNDVEIKAGECIIIEPNLLRKHVDQKTHNMPCVDGSIVTFDCPEKKAVYKTKAEALTDSRIVSDEELKFLMISLNVTSCDIGKGKLTYISFGEIDNVIEGNI